LIVLCEADNGLEHAARDTLSGDLGEEALDEGRSST
jgi:hypothetical protein